MKKSYKQNEFSDQICQGKNCRRRLKRRRVEEHNDTHCYRCHQKKLKAAGKGHRDLSRAYLRKPAESLAVTG